MLPGKSGSIDSQNGFETYRGLISSRRVRELIRQVDLREGKRSCRLTAQLNAFILTGQISKKEAEKVQGELVNGYFAMEEWIELEELSGLGWSGDIHRTGEYVQSIVGREVEGSIRMYNGDLLSLVADLDCGFCAVVFDGHARTVFKTFENGSYYVFDPLMGIHSGYYDIESPRIPDERSLGSFQTENFYFIV